ncbi:MAG: NAD-dependent epimerase/dehydratase family protein [Clostridiales bacterium]|nr:NAD-dependent epimerase/dehydratase family protein [Clostridiales bacterium]
MTTVAITGITGNMGQATFEALNGLELDEIRLLIRTPKRFKKALKANKALNSKVKIIQGGMTDRQAVMQLVTGADIVINMAAVIPPRSDQNPNAAVACNQIGTELLVSTIESITDNQPALVHVSTVAVYGNRTGAHPFGRVGDPLLTSPLDVYSATKVRGEFRVLESKITKWAVIRQSAMLHPQMITDNVHDGLMFHTAYNAPLEWVTAHDSGVLIRNIIKKFMDGTMPDKFWKRCYNIAGGKANRRYGIQTFDEGFAIMGGSSKKFFKPVYNATRNFHGVWYLDGNELNDMFDFQSQTTEEYWQQVFKAHPIFKLGKLAPRSLIHLFLFRRLLNDKNAPSYWAKHGDEARMIAYFGGTAEYEKLKKVEWKDFPLLDPAQIPNFDDNETPVFYGYDITKPDEQITQADVAAVAEAHGGKLLSTFDGDMYKKLNFQTQDGELFSANAYTVLRAGHWYNPIYHKFVWDFDRLSKKDKIFASVWYDTHDKDEDMVYSFDANFVAHATKIERK